MYLVERVQCCPVGDQSAGKVKAFLTGEACLRREGCVRDTHRLPEWVFFLEGSLARQGATQQRRAMILTSTTLIHDPQPTPSFGFQPGARDVQETAEDKVACLGQAVGPTESDTESRDMLRHGLTGWKQEVGMSACTCCTV
jgi:hypothetical protein